MKEILSQIVPSAQEKKDFHMIVKSFLTIFNKNLSHAKAILGGSGAKDTWLKGNTDVDVFVLYNYQRFQQKTHEISNFLEPMLKKSFPNRKITKVHGSRDYFQLSYKNIQFEVVPILKIKRAEQAKNITDISPLHARWVNQHAKKTKNAIRLLKQFCKANRLYGAESHINGFSGYVLEILVAKYGSFFNVLKASQKWREKEVIDVSKFYKNKNAALFHLNKSKLLSPLIIIDPVDKLRNAAAALSTENFNVFKTLAKSYLKRPSSSFFQKMPLNKERLAQEAHGKNGHLLFITLQPLPEKDDIAGTKIIKIMQFLSASLQPFGVHKNSWEFNPKETIIYFFIKRRELPHEQIHPGPPLKFSSFVAEFKGKYKKTFEKNSRIYANVKTHFPRLEDHITFQLNQKYVQERIKKVIEISIN